MFSSKPGKAGYVEVLDRQSYWPTDRMKTERLSRDEVGGLNEQETPALMICFLLEHINREFSSFRAKTRNTLNIGPIYIFGAVLCS